MTDIAATVRGVATAWLFLAGATHAPDAGRAVPTSACRGRRRRLPLPVHVSVGWPSPVESSVGPLWKLGMITFGFTRAKSTTVSRNCAVVSAAPTPSSAGPFEPPFSLSFLIVWHSRQLAAPLADDQLLAARRAARRAGQWLRDAVALDLVRRHLGERRRRRESDSKGQQSFHRLSGPWPRSVSPPPARLFDAGGARASISRGALLF